MTKRIIIPFSSSSFFLFSPIFQFFKSTDLQIINPNKLPKEHKDNQEKPGGRKQELIYEPCGIHVARTESLLFLLLKAVLIPTTIRYFLFLDDSFFFRSCDKGAPLLIDS
jgi:hypothetical protein